MTTTTSYGANATQSVVGIVAPGALQGFFLPGNMYGYPNSRIHGSSIAAPVVSGIAGLVRNGLFWAWGASAMDARVIMANTLLMGDGWWASNNTTPLVKTDYKSGSGRIKVHWPSNTNMVSPWAWGTHWYTLSQGQSVTWTIGSGGAIPPSMTQYKAATVIMPNAAPNNLVGIPDIDFYAEDTCPPGGGVVTVASDAGFDLRGRFRLPQANITGKCLRFRAYAYGVNGTATFYVADYLHSGSPAIH